MSLWRKGYELHQHSLSGRLILSGGLFSRRAYQLGRQVGQGETSERTPLSSARLLEVDEDNARLPLLYAWQVHDTGTLKVFLFLPVLVAAR